MCSLFFKYLTKKQNIVIDGQKLPGARGKVHKCFIIRGASFIFFNVSCGAGSTSAPALSSLAPASSVSYHVAAWKLWFTVIFSLTGRCQPCHLLPHLFTYVGISPFKGKCVEFSFMNCQVRKQLSSTVSPVPGQIRTELFRSWVL